MTSERRTARTAKRYRVLKPMVLNDGTAWAEGDEVTTRELKADVLERLVERGAIEEVSS